MWLENDNKSCIKHVKPNLWHKYKGLSQEKIANTDLKGCNKKQKDKKAQNLAHPTPQPPEIYFFWSPQKHLKAKCFDV